MRFTTLYAEHFETIRAYCARRLPAADANDAVADAFVVVWRKIDEAPEGERTLPWLYRIARNVVLHAHRSSSRRARLSWRASDNFIPTQSGADVPLVEHSEAERIRVVLGRLAPADQEVLRLKVWEELTAPEIAEVIGTSLAAAEKRIERAYKKLGRTLQVDGYRQLEREER